MKLYLLTRKDHVGYDEYDSALIRAKDEASARAIAAEHFTGYCGYSWSNPDLINCEVVVNRGETGIVISSFNAG